MKSLPWLVTPKTEITTQPIFTMSTLVIKGYWNIIKGKLKQRWGKLADNDLRYLQGKEMELLGRIQKRTGRPR